MSLFVFCAIRNVKPVINLLTVLLAKEAPEELRPVFFQHVIVPQIYILMLSQPNQSVNHVIKNVKPVTNLQTVLLAKEVTALCQHVHVL